MPAVMSEPDANIALTSRRAYLEPDDKGRKNVTAAALAIHAGGKRRSKSRSACMKRGFEMQIVVIKGVRKRAVHQCDRCCRAFVAVERQRASSTLPALDVVANKTRSGLIQRRDTDARPVHDALLCCVDNLGGKASALRAGNKIANSIKVAAGHRFHTFPITGEAWFPDTAAHNGCRV